MLGDRNIFRPVLSPDAIEEAARELDAESARYADADADVEDVLRQVEDLLARIEARRNAIAAQAGFLRAAGAVTSIGEPEVRADAARTMISALEDFAVRADRLLASARDPSRSPSERMAIARRLRDSAVRILRAAGDFDPVSDAVSDVKRLAVDVATEARSVGASASTTTVVIVVAAAVLAVALFARDLVR
jgi:hypothetical protein